MANPRFEPTITLGAILQALALVISIAGAVAYVSERQEELIMQDRQIVTRQAEQQRQIEALGERVVHKDVADEHDRLIMSKIDGIADELDLIEDRIGLSTRSSRGAKH